MILFSERKGLHPIERPFQLGSIDRQTRNQLWSILYIRIFSKYHQEYPYSPVDSTAVKVEKYTRALWTWYFKNTVDSLPDPVICIEKIKQLILESEYNEVLDMVEYIVKTSDDTTSDYLRTDINDLFKNESCGYRFIKDEVVEITSDLEINEIETAAATSFAYSIHISRALELLSDKKAPDYRNSIKESISAVEAICRETCGREKSTLGDALKLLKSEIALNSVFQSAMSKVYGFVSDDGGIRHSLLESSSMVTYSDAKYFLIMCSAFVNYIRELR